jgi:hypothetical protein
MEEAVTVLWDCSPVPVLNLLRAGYVALVGRNVKTIIQVIILLACLLACLLA